MANLIEQLQEVLQTKPLQKVDANTQEVNKAAVDTSNASKLQQAVISAVLTGFYKLTRTPEGAAEIIRGNLSTGWGDLLFDKKRDELVSRISTYAVESPANIKGELELVATEAAGLIDANAGGQKTATPQNIMEYMKQQRNDILQHLPAALQLGELLNDDTIDDHTHKMDGPVSGLMHKIEQAFSGAPPEEPQTKEPQIKK